ncbi:MAG: glutamate-cysteine ligase family protein [Planctomycetaceae bacterium]
MSNSIVADRIATYLRSHFKRAENHLVGMEVEHICIRTIDAGRIAYDSGGGCVLDVLQSLQGRLGGEKAEVDGRWVGLNGEWGKVTLEPGNQIEWSSPPRSTCHQLINDLDRWLMQFKSVLRDLGLMSLPEGYDTTSIRHVPQSPGRRYELMCEHYASKDDVAHKAMFNTAGIHVNFDCSDDLDWQKKFRLMLLASPVAIAIFANSPGHLNGSRYVAVRPVLWRNMDPERCQLPADVFRDDFSLDDYARWIADRPMLLSQRDSVLHLGSGQSLAERFPDGDVSQNALELHLGSIFTPVRINGPLEVRTIDTQPDDRLGAVSAFWSGLLNHAPTLDQTLDLLWSAETADDWSNLLIRACRFGRHDPELSRQSHELLDLAFQGLRAREGSDSAGVSRLSCLSDTGASTAIVRNA